MRYVEVRRHTDHEGDRLTPTGIADVEAIRDVDPVLVERESMLLGTALRQVLEALPEGGRALVVGHSPTNEAAILGLTGRAIAPIRKGEGVLLREDRGSYQIEPLS